ncbi:MAG: tyrosine-protein phosphatase [Acidimicrobiales bacterium]
MEPADPSRHIALRGCCNFRDLGGYPTADGRRTCWRRLFRADGLAWLTDGDLEILTELGVRSVIDLRTPLEMETRGRFRDDVDGVAYHHLPLTDTLPGEEQVPAWDDTAFVSSRYATMLRDGADTVTRAVTMLADADNLPAVFHCSVGKDRTGVLSAVVLGLLGVPDEVIVEDYALSASAMERILERLQGEFPDAAEVVTRYAPVILSVEPDSMAGFLAAVHHDHGSFAALAVSLGLTGAVERLQAELLQAV